MLRKSASPVLTAITRCVPPDNVSLVHMCLLEKDPSRKSISFEKVVCSQIVPLFQISTRFLTFGVSLFPFIDTSYMPEVLSTVDKHLPVNKTQVDEPW